MVFKRSRFKNTGEFTRVFLLSLCFLLPAAAWYAWVIPTWDKSNTVSGLIGLKSGQLPGILDIIKFHFTTTLPRYMLNFYAMPLFVTGIVVFFLKRYYTKGIFIAVLS